MRAKQCPLKYIKTEKHLHQCQKQWQLYILLLVDVINLNIWGEMFPPYFFFPRIIRNCRKYFIGEIINYYL